MSVFIDANIPMYAAGKPSVYKDKCKEILAGIAAGKLDAVTDAEVFQEILYRYYHIRQMELGRQIFAEFRQVIDTVLPVRSEEVFLAEELTQKYPAIKPRDLLHVSAMQLNGIEEILSVDRDFDPIEEVARQDPLDFDPHAGKVIDDPQDTTDSEL